MPATQITEVASTNASNTPAGAGGLLQTLTVAVPPGTVDGQVIFAFVTHVQSKTLTAPAGWTQVSTRLDDATNNLSASVYWRVANSEPASYNWTIGTSSDSWNVIHTTFDGVNTTTPVNAFATNVSTAATNPLVTPSVTATTQGYIVGFQATRSSDTVEKTSTTGDANTNELQDVGLDGGVTCRNGHAYFRTVIESGTGSRTGVSINMNTVTNITSRARWTLNLNVAPPIDSDSGTVTESETFAPMTFGDSDSGTVTESEAITIPVADADSGTGTESENIVAVTEYLVSDDFDRDNETSLNISSSGHLWTAF